MSCGEGSRADGVSAGPGEVASLLSPLSRELATPVDDPDEEDHEAGELSRDRVRGCSFSLSFPSSSSRFEDDKSSADADGSLDEGGGRSADEEDASEFERGRERSSRCFGGRSEEDGGGEGASVDGGDEGEAERGEGGMTGMTGRGGGDGGDDAR